MKVLKVLTVLTASNLKMHKYLLLIGLVSLLLYGGLIEYTLLYKAKDPGNALQFSSFLIQSGMLFFLLIGYQLATKNLTSSLYQVANKEMRKLHCINISFLFILSLLFVLTFIISTNIYYHCIDPTNSFVKESSLFFLYYWWLPFIISALIGYIFGLSFSSKIVYVCIFIVWALLSPTNLNFLNNLLVNSQLIEVANWLQNINLGVSKVDELYNSLFSFEFDWYKKGMLLLTLILIVILQIIFLKKWRFQQFSIILVFVLLLCYSSIPYHYSKKQLQDIPTLAKEYEYYRNLESTPKQKYFDYRIDKVNLSIQNTNLFSVTAKLQISNVKDPNIAFTLYKGFKIKNISLDNGKPVKYYQTGDYIYVNLSEINKKKINTLKFTYSGNGSLRNPSIGDVVYLPHNFTWIPSNQRMPTHYLFNQGVTAAAINNSPNIEYSLILRDNQRRYFTNLRYQGKGRYYGVAKGVTLITGKLTDKHDNNMEVVYPSSWFPYKEEFKQYVTQYKEDLQRYNRLLKTKNKIPQRIILLPTMDPLVSGINPHSIGDGTNLIIHMDPSKFTRVIPIEQGIPFQIDSAFNEYNSLTEKQRINWLIFNSFVGFKISNKSHAAESLFYFYLESIHSALTSNEQKILKDLINLRERLSNEFLKKWKYLICDNEEDDWKQIRSLIKESLLKERKS
ncbi:hypothetical protein [Rummeliibacillus sp. BSL5]